VTGAVRSFGILAFVPRPPQQPDPVAQRAVEKERDPIGQGQHHGHHHGRLNDERQARQPQFDAVPPIEEAAHPARVFEPVTRLPSGGVVGSPEAKVLDVIDRLVEELRDVVVIEAVDDVAAHPVAGHQAQRAEQSKLV
jgi:hypothetical protein